MPLLIEHIDAIARKLKRDVLFVEFHQPEPCEENENMELEKIQELMKYDHENDDRRKSFLSWLDEHQIEWCYSYGVASECGIEPYLGQVYIDLAMDEADPVYCRLRDCLENLDGTMRDENVRLYVLRLEDAMQNAHHDEPGFLERWNETF